MTKWFVGTMGYGYDDWKGVFYPPHAKQGTYLRHYAKIFNAVELDTTFYGIPSKEKVIRWRSQVAPGFIFCPKTPREITHTGDLQLAVSDMARFVESMRHFEQHLGPILIQFPPEWDASNFKQLEEFAAALPAGLQFAVEFRNISWNNKQVRDLLIRHGLGWVSTEYIIMPKELVRTSSFAYIRFIGRHGRYERKDRVRRDVGRILSKWRKMINAELDQTEALFAFFNNDFSGHSPTTANEFKNRFGLPVSQPEIPRQGTLF